MFKNINPETRKGWRATRVKLEKQVVENRIRSSMFGYKKWPKATYLHAIKSIVRFFGLYPRGMQNARNFKITKADFNFPDLPSSFEGYTILHLSDLHIGEFDDLPAMIGEKFSELNPDLVVMTGDFQTFATPSEKQTADLISLLAAKIDSQDGWLAVLGNHDSHEMLDALEAINVRVLANETVGIFRGADQLLFVGADDVFAFYTPDAIEALQNNHQGFRIALVHTVDLASVAAKSGYSLYLSGHTHGGQMCLPGGQALLTGLDSHRQLASGQWKLDALQGYTSRGLGHGVVPLRFNCPGEATLIRLKTTT